MSLVSTLAKVAVGVAVAKGVSSLAKGGAARQSAGRSGGGIASGSQQAGGTGSIADMLGGMMGGAQPAGNAPGGAGGGGNIMDQLGQMMGGGTGGMPGGLGGLLDALGGGAAGGGAAGGLGGMLNASLQHKEPPAAPTRTQEDQAALLLRAMIQAAKCDGRIDQAEKQALTKHLGDISREEARVLEEAFAAPVDIDALVEATPRGMEAQVYMMSLLGLDLDSQAEAQYLHGLAQKLGIDPKTANTIHQKMGEPALYS